MTTPTFPITPPPPTPNPFASLLRSRKFWMAIAALGNTVISTYFSVPEAIVVSLNLVIAVVIGSIAYEDGQAAQ